MHNRRDLLRGLLTGLLVLLGIMVAIPVNVVSSYLPAAVTGHRAWWIGALIGAALLTVSLTWLSGWLGQRTKHVRFTGVRAVDSWVDREQAAQVVNLLATRNAKETGITAVIGLVGAGGFGKTTLAAMVCADRLIQRQFTGGSPHLTVGQGVRGAALADKINGMAGDLGGNHPGFADPEIAGQHLMRLLDSGPRRLLVLDDVWSAEQLIPFSTGGRHCALLITTRLPGLLPADAHRVLVDQMSAEQARQMIAGSHFTLPHAIVEDLIRVTGRWPLLLELVAGRLREVAALPDGDVAAAARRTVQELTNSGPTALDMTVYNDRAKAVSINIGLSLDMLPGGGSDRFAELGIFAAETPVPVWVVARLWMATAALSEKDSRALCREMGQLSLVRYRADSDTIELHEVIRAYLVHSPDVRLPDLHANLVDSLADCVSAADSLRGDNEPGPGVLAWWELGEEETYLWDNLAWHIAEAKRPAQFEQVITDLRWVTARLNRSGPAAVLADLSHGSDAETRAAALSWELRRIEHLLTPTVPAPCISDILLSRLRDESMWHDEVDRILATVTVPHLISRWPLPDVPDERLRRVLTGHSHQVTSVAISPDGTWLASGSLDGTIRIWDAAAGHCRKILTGHAGGVETLALSPDGTWLASADGATTVYLWDLPAGKLRTSFDAARSDGDRLGWVTQLAASPDSTWLAAVNLAGSVGQWEAATGQPRTPRAGGPYATNAAAISPDGSWLATASQIVRIWDTATGEEHHTIVTDHDGEVGFVVFSPDGSWLATASHGYDSNVKLWDTATGQLRLSIRTRHTAVWSVTPSPDGMWLATTGADLDPTIQFWDTQTGERLGALHGDSLRVRSVAISPDGRWIAAGDQDASLRIWDLFGGHRTDRTYGSGLSGPVAISPDSTWLAATGDRERTAVICDILTGRQMGAVPFPSDISRVAISPDGAWFATLSSRSVQIWDAATCQPRPAPAGEDHVNAIAISPSGAWLATGHRSGVVRVWDVTAGKPRASFAANPGRSATLIEPNDIKSISFSPDSTWMAAIVDLDYNVWIWDIGTGEPRPALPHDHPVKIAVIAPDGAWLATAGREGTVRIWDAGTNRLRFSFDAIDEGGKADADDPTWIESVTISPDGTWLATTAAFDTRIRIWASADSRHLTDLGDTAHAARTAAVSADGAWLATVSGGAVATAACTIMIWDTATWECVAETRVAGRVDHCAWTPDSLHIAMDGAFGVYLFDFHPGRAQGKTSVTLDAGFPDRETGLSAAAGPGQWPDKEGEAQAPSLQRNPGVVTEDDVPPVAMAVRDLVTAFSDPVSDMEQSSAAAPRRATAPRLAFILAGHTGQVLGVAFSPDGQLLASGGGSDRTVRLWDPVTGTHLHTLSGHDGWVGNTTFSPDGRLLASGGGDCTVRLWDPVTGTHLRTLTGHGSLVYGVAFGLDGRLLASASDDKTVRLWDPVTGQHLDTLDTHSDTAFDVAFSPDGRLLASASKDASVRVWDLASGELRHTLTCHTGWVRAVRFSPDGRLLASTGDDYTVQLLDPATGRHLHTLAGHTNWAGGLAFSPDGMLLASNGGGFEVQLWDPATGSPLHTLVGHTGGINGVVFSPDGMLLASASDDTTIRLWNLTQVDA